MIRESKELRERLYEIDHSSGLKIFVMPKANYKSTYAVFGTKYGSIDTCFKRSDQKEYTRVPEGIAHFWNTNCLKAKSWTRLRDMQRPAPLQTLLLPLIKRVIFSSVQTGLQTALRSSLIL